LSFAAVVLTDVVPKCDYYPRYAYVHKVKRFAGVYAVEDSFVYPDDHTELDLATEEKWKAKGNPIIDHSVSGFIVRLVVMQVKLFKLMIRFVCLTAFWQNGGETIA